MRQLLPILLCVPLLFGTAVAEDAKKAKRKQDPAKPLTADQAADAVLVAVNAKDQPALKALAEKVEPDPWLVANVLCNRSERNAARDFAALLGGPEAAALVAYVEKAEADVPAVEALERAENLLNRAKDPKGALEAVAEVESSDPVLAVRILRARGFALARTQRLDEGADAFELAAADAGKLGWLAQASASLHLAGFCAAVRSDHERAARHWEARIEVDTRRGDRRSVAATLGNLAILAQRSGDLRAAKQHQEKTLALARELKDQVLELNTLNSLGSVHADLGNYPRALALYEEALAGYETRKDAKGVAMVTESIGGAHLGLGDYREAARHLRAALVKREALGEPRETADVCLNLAIALKNLGEYDESLELVARALAVHEADGNRRAVAIALTHMGSLRRGLGDYDEAERLYARTKELSDEIGDRPGIGSALTNLALVRDARGDVEGALAMNREALAIDLATGAKPAIAHDWTNIGNCLWRLGRYSQALAAHEKALALHEQLGDKDGLAKALGNLGSLHSQLGDHARRADYYQRAMAAAEASGDATLIAALLMNMASMAERDGERAAATDAYKRLIAGADAQGKPHVAARGRARLGLLHLKAHEYELALPLLLRAKEAEGALGRRRQLAIVLTSLVETYAGLSEFDQAQALVGQATTLAREVGAEDLKTLAEWTEAKLSLKRGRLKAAISLARSAAIRIPGMLSGLSDLQGATAREKWTGVYEVGASAAFQQGDVPSSLEFVESGRSGALLESLGGGEALRNAVVPVALREAEARARAQVAVTRRRLDEALQVGHRATIRKRHVAHREAMGRVSEVIDRMQREAKEVAQLLYPGPASIANIQASLAAGETLVYYDLLHAHAIAIVVRHNAARMVDLGERAAIGAAGQGLIGLRAESEVEAALRQARAVLIAPLELDEPTGRVLISPDGVLHDVSFAALMPGHEIALVPSGTTLSLLRQRKRPRGQSVLAIGDPSYIDRTRLPAARAEVEAIGDRKLLGPDATPAKLRAALEQQSRWRAVHLACHGVVDHQRPLLSMLALSPTDGVEGRLSVLDLFQLDMPADLVALSACETARGRSYEGEGLVGFVRALMFAGAPRVLASLWKVDDEATQELMVKFYALWNPKDGSTGLGAAAALKQAQAHIRDHPDHPKWKHPYYWAAWVLWGLPE